MSVDTIFPCWKYNGKTVKEVYCGWKKPEEINAAKYINLKLEEFIANAGLLLNTGGAAELADLAILKAEGNNVTLLSNYFTKDYDYSGVLNRLSSNNKWKDDIISFGMNVKRSTKREWYKRDSEFMIGDGDPFYVKYCLLQNDISLSQQDKIQLESLSIFKISDFKFELLEASDLDKETSRQVYSMHAQWEYIKMPGFLHS